MSEAFHGFSPRTNRETRLYQQSRSSFFDSADGSLNYSISLGSTWGGRVMRPKARTNSRLLSVWIVLGFLIWRTESLQTLLGALFWTSFWLDNFWISFVNTSCTTTAYPHCHLDTLSSVRFFLCAELTSAKTVDAKCTVISGKLPSALCSDRVILPTSQFGFGQCANTSCAFVGLLDLDLLDVYVRTR